MREFADRGIAHAKKMVTTLAEAKTPCELYVIHGHYADAGEVAALMSSTLDVDMCMTGHSLGRNKLEHLLASGTVSKAEIESTYKISRRVEAEERALESAIMVFTSTKQEIDEQWGLYDGWVPHACIPPLTGPAAVALTSGMCNIMARCMLCLPQTLCISKDLCL